MLPPAELFHWTVNRKVRNMIHIARDGERPELHVEVDGTIYDFTKN
jgi:hypothetical protein